MKYGGDELGGLVVVVRATWRPAHDAAAAELEPS